MKKTCENCQHFDPSGYNTKKETQHLGFCNRFTQVTSVWDKECKGYIPSNEKEIYHKELNRKQQLKLSFNNQLDLFQ